MDTATDLSQLDDTELIQLTRSGHPTAFGHLWQRHASAAHRFARSFRVDPEDVVSEAFASVLTAIRRGRGPTESFRAYLFTSVRNGAIRYSAERKRWVSLDGEEDSVAGEWVTVREPELDVHVERALGSLPARWRDVLTYTELDGLSREEAADALGIAPNALSALAMRARRGLRAAWIHSYRETLPVSSPCRVTLRHLESRLLGRPVEVVIDPDHTRTCDLCSALLAELGT